MVPAPARRSDVTPNAWVAERPGRACSADTTADIEPDRGGNMGRIGRRGFVVTAAGALAAFATAGDAAARVPSEEASRGRGRGRRTGCEFRGMWLATVGNRDWPSRSGLPADRQ